MGELLWKVFEVNPITGDREDISADFGLSSLEDTIQEFLGMGWETTAEIITLFVDPHTHRIAATSWFDQDGNRVVARSDGNTTIHKPEDYYTSCTRDYTIASLVEPPHWPGSTWRVGENYESEEVKDHQPTPTIKLSGGKEPEEIRDLDIPIKEEHVPRYSRPEPELTEEDEEVLKDIEEGDPEFIEKLVNETFGVDDEDWGIAKTYKAQQLPPVMRDFLHKIEKVKNLSGNTEYTFRYSEDALEIDGDFHPTLWYVRLETGQDKAEYQEAARRMIQWLKGNITFSDMESQASTFSVN